MSDWKNCFRKKLRRVKIYLSNCFRECLVDMGWQPLWQVWASSKNKILSTPTSAILNISTCQHQQFSTSSTLNISTCQHQQFLTQATLNISNCQNPNCCGRALAGSPSSHGSRGPPRRRHYHHYWDQLYIVNDTDHNENDHPDQQVWLGWPVRAPQALFPQQLASH